MKVQKSEMLSLADGVGWAPIIITARVFVPPTPPFFYLGSWCVFAFAATFKECGLSIIELFHSVKPSYFNMIMSVKIIGCFLSKKYLMMSFLETIQCMWITIVTLTGVFILSFFMLIVNKLFPKKSTATCYNISFSWFWNGHYGIELLSNLLSINIAQYYVL